MCSGLSARERNKLKRKSRALHRSGSAEGSSKRSKSGNEAADAALEQAEAEEDGQEWQAVAAGQWPFQAICDQMCMDVLDPVWEVRQLSHLLGQGFTQGPHCTTSRLCSCTLLYAAMSCFMLTHICFTTIALLTSWKSSVLTSL